jgi:hypothetical protein
MQRTLDLVRVIRAAFPRQSFTEETEVVYTTALADIDQGILGLAIYEAVTTCTELPTVADIRQIARAKAADALPDIIFDDEKGVDWRAAYDAMDESDRAAAEARLVAMGVRPPT